MKKKNLFVMSGIAAVCALGFGLNVSANTTEVKPVMEVKETAITTQVSMEDTTTTTTEDTATDTTTSPCPNGHENCDGTHAFGDCPYGNEPGTGMGYHHGEDQDHGHGLHDGSGHANGNGHHTNNAQ